MRYVSSRGREEVSSSQAILQGIAKDGGLFCPLEIPKATFLDQLATLSYREIAVRVISLWFDDFSTQEIEEIVQQGYRQANFPGGFVGLREIHDGWLLNLWHGPTFAFKDMALSLFSLFQKKAKEKCAETRRTVILTATSGDTGSAVLSGFAKDPETEVYVFYPQGKVSDFQEAQMLSFASKTKHVIAIEGNFDDCQTLIKKAFAEIHLDNTILSSANSINLARIVPQMVYYFAAYGRLLAEGVIKQGEEVTFTVPTGNFGDVLAGYYAKRMGLPIHKLVVASNENAVLTSFFQTGLYNRKRPFHQTASPSMDILISSNLERLLFETSSHDFSRVQKWMSDLSLKGEYQVEDDILQALKMFEAYWAKEHEAAKTIRDVHDQDQWLVEAHTAVGVACMRKHVQQTKDSHIQIVLSTASPIKFAPFVLSSLGEEVPMEANLQIERLRQGYQVFDARAKLFLYQTNPRTVWPLEEALSNLRRHLDE